MMLRRSLLLSALTLCVSAGTAVPGANAQGFINKKQDLPDASHFYMSRMQVQVVDDSPVITRQAGNPGGQQQQGGMPPQVALPRAGFQSYTNDIPGLSTNLPKVNNGVPPKMPPKQQLPNGARGHSGKLPGNKAAVARPKPAAGPAQVQAYAPYKGFNPNNFNGNSSGASASSGQTQTNVRGNVLHWAHRHGQ